jgi:hypothetical protein
MQRERRGRVWGNVSAGLNRKPDGLRALHDPKGIAAHHFPDLFVGESTLFESGDQIWRLADMFEAFR